MPLTRRDLLVGAVALPALYARERADQIATFLEHHHNPDGGYSWIPGDRSHITPTFAAVGCYRNLGTPVPQPKAVADFVRNNYPVPERRRTERPLWRFDYEQVQSLLWLNEPINSFQQLAAAWTRPAEFTTSYELNGYPVFQHQAMAVCVRRMTGVDGGSNDAWLAYFRERRRADGTFNHTPASDGSAGHVTNTVWGFWALESLGADEPPPPQLADWVRACQLPSGGFTYEPHAAIGGVDDVFYTWAALWLLNRAGKQPKERNACVDWVSALETSDGGFQDRPGGVANPTATYYALECFKLLHAGRAQSSKRAVVARAQPIPGGSRVFTMQVEAPGAGSPSEAVFLAQKLGIHIWTAKNAAAGWIGEAQRIADARKVPVLFAVGNEEYGTYVKLAGLGTYSHLSDIIAPDNHKTGEQMPKKNFAYPWTEFRDTRIRELKQGSGRMIWQFNENEELTRVLLDEAAGTGTYGAIATFHFGNENFLDSQPFLMRWYGRIPMVALQDAHGGESWWWGDFLSGFRTLFIAREPTWQGWLEALERDHVMAVRYDKITNWQMQLAGGSPAVRKFVLDRKKDWCWWGDDGSARERPTAVMTVLKPGMRFETKAPDTGTAVRIRLWADNTGQAKPKEPRAELLRLAIDGKTVQPSLVSTDTDHYAIYHVADSSAHEATATVRVLSTGRELTISRKLKADG
jgi:hypothetical protein